MVKCSDCLYFNRDDDRKVSESVVEKSVAGHCRRYPPVVTGLNGEFINTVQPRVLINDRCGEGRLLNVVDN